MKRSRAFSLVEILIAVVIMAILGGAIMMALNITWGGYMQAQDLVGGRQDIEYAFQSLSLQLSTASLGMGNNRNTGQFGSFSNAFRGKAASLNSNDITDDPIMAFMGRNGESWGGPVTVADFGYNHAASGAPTLNVDFRATMVQNPIDPLSPDIYAGTALYYVWGAPVYAGDRRAPLRLINTHITTTEPRTNINNNRTNPLIRTSTITFNYGDDVDLRAPFSIEGREWKLEPGGGRDMRSWVVSPNIGLPLLVNGVTGNQITLEVSPGTAWRDMPIGTDVGGYVELYAAQACRLYVNERRELVQEIFGENFRDSGTSRVNVLARNVVGSYFIFDKQRHMLTMYMAVRGVETGGSVGDSGGYPHGWPAAAPPIMAADRGHRITVQSMTLRIRN